MASSSGSDSGFDAQDMENASLREALSSETGEMGVESIEQSTSSSNTSSDTDLG